MLPVAWPALEVSEGHDDDLGFTQVIDHLVREPLDQQAARPWILADSSARFVVRLEERECRQDRVVKLGAKPRALGFIPTNGLDEFF